MSNCSKSDRTAIRNFITEPKVSTAVGKAVKSIFPDNPALKQNLFHVRGLLVHRILLLALKKRWHVQYGLHPERDPIAVPFYAKGIASDQAEWGHPDVAILLTCLAFYYDGLNGKQLYQSLEHVLKSDGPASIYDQWSINCPTLPDALREWNSINLEDEQQMLDLKLQASGWEIPLSSLDNPNSMTTGFSGTNDNRNLLPLTLKQQDLPGLSHTNAAVLSYLLQQRNRRYVVIADDRNRHISETELLCRISKRGIRVLIDAGAQILEFNNEALARAWLDIDRSAQAAVFFDDSGKPMVAHKGVVVYLDEAHCRGVDLKLPADSMGALTLGLGVTKDHIVQGAMRLRQLATTQAITFFAPPEVNQNFLTDAGQREQYLDTLRQKEQLSLERLYGVKTKSKAVVGSGTLTPRISDYVKELDAMRKNFRDNGDAVHHSALQEVEQEREVAYEIEAVREMQKPTHCAAWSFPGLDKDIVTFTRTGRLPAGSTCCEQAFLALRKTSLYVSKEFLRSVKVTSQPHDNFLRPVSWILWSPVTQTALSSYRRNELLIPILRNTLAPACYSLDLCSTYKPARCSFTSRISDIMRYQHFQKLDCTDMVVSAIVCSSGGLYFEFSKYEYLCNFLGFQAAQNMGESQKTYLENEFNGVPDANDNSKTQKSVCFTSRPLTFLQEWLSV
ncbi:hypothetical protein DID88_003512 [Monilinia fructigena]|uniref:ubiquitinyl hydrolase 1 n=1 Tax=Monilinia fructigena TaxID=38457 RepID=A0A395IZU3_9HELO|nr:hypothetical protein DID88_003512 [Monilinia fructigena]